MNNSKINEILTTVVRFYHNKYGELLEQVWLYGSKARGDETAGSDVDIMVVLDDRAIIDKTLRTDIKKYELAMDILAKYDELITPMEYPLTDFKNNRISLHRNVKKEGVLYYEK